ncbi:thiamine transporter 1-like [Cylas formicarius]|uniref:thiamine transporter 1-like n=1 Tax=Cylas formicarius TaxID=197179 RepID=UPI0029586B88|nr:thiamine transporter 1-like [Cylas formicarius]
MLVEKIRRGLDEWLIISILLCIFGFLKEIRPSEPFVYEFLIGPWRNLTDLQVNQQVYPVGTYSYLAQLVIVFLITDLCRYKPLIVLLGSTGIIVWAMLLWTTSLLEVQILEVLYGTFCACEVAYFTYIYAKVDREWYQLVTSHTRAAILLGRALSGIMAQLLISFELMDYRELNYITLSAMIGATFWSLFLPPAGESIYFHHNMMQQMPFLQKSKEAYALMWSHFVQAYSNKYTAKWSVWWALSTCGFIQVQVYMQPLWWAIVGDPKQKIYNGVVEAVLTVIGFLGALVSGLLKIDWKTKGDLSLACCSLLQGFTMIIASQTTQVVISYISYIVFGALYHLMITVASSEIAKHIKEDSYGLIFGINTFAALAFQTILTLGIVTGDMGFALPPRRQYFAYGFYHIILALVYIIIGLGSWFSSKYDYRRTSVTATETVSRL